MRVRRRKSATNCSAFLINWQQNGNNKNIYNLKNDCHCVVIMVFPQEDCPTCLLPAWSIYILPGFASQYSPRKRIRESVPPSLDPS